jgi:hypothetical protein
MNYRNQNYYQYFQDINTSYDYINSWLDIKKARDWWKAKSNIIFLIDKIYEIEEIA